MNEFSCNWASALLETMYHSEFDEGFGKLCTQCEEDAKEKCIGLYRCTDCFQSPILCKACAIRTHKWNPFHRLQMWTELIQRGKHCMIWGLSLTLAITAILAQKPLYHLNWWFSIQMGYKKRLWPTVNVKARRAWKTDLYNYAIKVYTQQHSSKRRLFSLLHFWNNIITWRYSPK